MAKILPMYKDRIVRTAEEAFEFVQKSSCPEVILYRTSRIALEKELRKFLKMIQGYNSDVGDIDKQILLANPHFWEDIDGSLNVSCAAIANGIFEEKKGSVAIMGWNFNSLIDIRTKKPIDNHGLNTFAII